MDGNVLYQVLALIGAGLLIWVLYRYIKAKPALLSRENLSKSFSTMGFLGLILIGFVALLVFIVQQT